MLRHVAQTLEPPSMQAGMIVVPPARAAFAVNRGHCRPFGPTVRSGGVNFAVFSRHAEAVTLVLFKDGLTSRWPRFRSTRPLTRPATFGTSLSTAFRPDVQYGYRVRGPLVPKAATATTRRPSCSTPTPRPSAAAPVGATARGPRRGRVVVDEFDWEDDAPPATPLSQTVIYEVHVRGFTAIRRPAWSIPARSSA